MLHYVCAVPSLVMKTRFGRTRTSVRTRQNFDEVLVVIFQGSQDIGVQGFR